MDTSCDLSHTLAVPRVTDLQMTVTILVVDDEAPIRDFVAQALRQAGYTTFTAADGPEALALSERGGSFDLLLVDLIMPQMFGDELAHQMRRRHPRLRVLYLTGYSKLLFKERIMLRKNEAFLDKPFAIEGLLEAISLLLFGHCRAGRRTFSRRVS